MISDREFDTAAVGESKKKIKMMQCDQNEGL